jgi:hypothetical protein
MKTVATMDLAEAAWYLKNGLSLEGLELRTSKVEPGRSLAELVFSGERAGELALEGLTQGAKVNAADMQLLLEALGQTAGSRS